MSDIEKLHHKTFEELKHLAEDGGEYWSARELYPVLEYSSWQKFEPVITKAIEACRNSGYEPSAHFNHTVKMAHPGPLKVMTVEKEYPGSWHHRRDGRRNSGAYTYIIGVVL